MVPEGWTNRRLDKVVQDFIVPQRDKPKVFDGDIPWCRIEDIEGRYLHDSQAGRRVSQEVVDEMNLRIFPRGTVLVSCSANLGECAIAARPLVTNQTFIGLVCDSVDKEFLYYRMTASAPRLNALSGGTTISYLPRREFEAFQVLLPPVPEQQKIAAILSSVDGAIAATRKVIEQTKRMKKGLLQELMTRGIGHTRFKKTEIGEIPEEWEVVTGRQVFKLFGGQKPKQLNEPETNGPFLYLKVGDFNRPGNQYGLSEAELTFGAETAKEVRIHHPGAVVFPKRGAAIFQERVQMLEEPATVDPNLMVLESKGPVPEFLRLYLLGLGMSQICDNSGVPQINNKHLYPMKIPIPPQTEQRQIAELVEGVSSAERENHRALAQLEGIKRGLMQDLLTGRVRVPGD